MKKKKLIVIGLDGMEPKSLNRMVKEGVMPNVSRLMQKGVYSEVYPVVQTATATNWATINTGSYPGSHGVDSFASHLPGMKPHEYRRYDILPTDASHPASKNNITTDEYFWTAAERQGKKCLIVNWPCAWPPTVKKAVVINGVGPESFQAEIFPGLIHTSVHKAKKEKQISLKIRKAKGWRNLPDSTVEPLEAEIHLTGEKQSKIYHLLLYGKTTHYDTLSIYSSKSDSRPLATMKDKEWSGWLNEKFSKIRKCHSEKDNFRFEQKTVHFKGYFKFRLNRISSDGKQIELYRSPVFNISNWASRESDAFEMVNDYMEEKGIELAKGRQKEVNIRDFYEAANPVSYLKENFVEKDRLDAENLSFVVSSSVKRHPDWDILMVYAHAPDTFNHYEMGQVSPGTAGYKKSKEKKHWDLFRREFATLDRFIGKLSKLSDKETIVVVISDHGCIAVDRQVWINKFFIDQGLMKYRKNSDGEYEYIPQQSKVFVGESPLNTYIWFNLKGRENGGIVSPKEIPRLEQKVLDVLYDIKDPQTGFSPFSLILRKRDASLLGLWGKQIGDILFLYREGYMQPEFTVWGPITPREWNDFSRDGFGPAAYNFPDCYGQHGSYLPSTTYKGFKIAGIFVAAGPGLKKGFIRKNPFWMTDVAPTLSYLLGIQPPRDYQGGIVFNLIKK